MERRLSGASLLACLRVVLVCLVMGLTLVGTWLNTLLGPEGSAVGRPSAAERSSSWSDLLVVVVPGWAFVFLSSSELLLCGVVRGLVGLLFEICIVDASIFTTRTCNGCWL